MATKKSTAASESESPSYVTTTLEGDVTTAKTAKDADTFHKMVIQEGTEFSGDPANQPVIVTKDVIEDFQYPRTQRPARRLVAAAGTLTTRRLAEEGGIKGVKDWSPEGDEPDNARGTRSAMRSTAEADRGDPNADAESTEKAQKAERGKDERGKAERDKDAGAGAARAGAAKETGAAKVSGTAKDSGAAK